MVAEGSAITFTESVGKPAPEVPVVVSKNARVTVRVETKNELMRRIVSTKDKALFKKSKSEFTEAELKFLQERLR
jgi:hypothetical protein